MIRDGHDDVKFFHGTEVEHTPAFGMKTLFVVGIQLVDAIAMNLRGCEHIYFGANMSFPNPELNDRKVWNQWERMIHFFLKKGYLCTLDIDVSSAEGLVESGLTDSHNFIPMISVKLPYAQQLGYNTTIKIDDKDFDATNPGVWCHSLHSLQNREAFTPWSKYTKDEVV
jgi:hypothetical protein|tara:strand:+ start:25685 stop:26191 length:507 start_codon:yes stop_codon:yes gene_type:complete